MTQFLRRLVPVLLLGLCLAGAQARAATATGSMVVSATVLSTCLVAVLPMAFGNYDATENDAQADVTVTCTGTTPWTLDIDGGGSGSISAREMTDGGSETLGYQLYTDAGRTTVFGDGVTGDTVAGTGTGLAQTVTVYGRVPASQFPAAGAYTDTVTVTLTY
nr:spore coat U domain-containing protein [Oceanococcus sp. HetDA_MAG_MS8]